MALTFNDLQTRGWQYATTTADNDITDATGGLACRFMGIAFAADTTASVGATAYVYNAATVTGTAVFAMEVRTLADAVGGPESKFWNFGPNGIRFGTGLSVSVTNADRLTVFWIVDD